MRKGFTLIELLIALTILVIIIAMVNNLFFHSVDTQKVNDLGAAQTILSNLLSIESGVKTYFERTGSYPPGNCEIYPNYNCTFLDYVPRFPKGYIAYYYNSSTYCNDPNVNICLLVNCTSSTSTNCNYVFEYVYNQSPLGKVYYTDTNLYWAIVGSYPK